MRLFHFSDDPSIARFVPRPVLKPSVRPPGQDWLNGPLVWAIQEDWSPLYLFPRECPRILLRPTARTTPEDLAQWWGGGAWPMVAYVEHDWLPRIAAGVLYRYDLPAEAFEDLRDAGMHVARGTVDPLGMTVLDDLLRELRACDVDLRPMESLAPLRDVWSTSLHASGIRLRNAKDWAA